MRQHSSTKKDYLSGIYDVKVKIAIARWETGTSYSRMAQETEIRKSQC